METVAPKNADPSPHPLSGDGVPSPEPIIDGPRTAGILMLVDACVAALSWIAQAHWDFTPTWTTVAETILLAALGYGLIRAGRKLLFPTVGLLATIALRPLIDNAPLFQQGGMAVLAGPLVIGALRILPTSLLLIGRPSRARVWSAVVLFVVAQILGLALTALHVYVQRRTDLP